MKPRRTKRIDENKVERIAEQFARLTTESGGRPRSKAKRRNRLSRLRRKMLVAFTDRRLDWPEHLRRSHWFTQCGRHPVSMRPLRVRKAGPYTSRRLNWKELGLFA